MRWMAGVERGSRPPRVLLLCLALWAPLSWSVPVHADPLDAAQSLRWHGCAASTPHAARLRRSAALMMAASLLARGLAPADAAARSGYRAERVATLHLEGPPARLRQTLQESACRTLADPSLRDAGVYQRGLDTWLILAAPYPLPSAAQAPAFAARAMALVNAARGRGARCGPRWFDPAPPLRRSSLLDDVAYGHAADMAEHLYFDHVDRSGRSPADRVRSAGYADRIVGENIAYGPATPEEVVQGWLHSPGHCENLMDSRFVEMGIAYAPGHADQPGLYWAQVLAAPRASSSRAATRRPQA